MRQFLSVVAFSLIMIGFFAWYSNYGIPQIKPAPPPKEEKVDLSAMTMPQFIALGAKIYKGKGTCTLCHTEVGGRAPLITSLGDVVPKRLADARYKGEAKDGEAYLLESLVKPSAFVVVGFGKKGTNDAESPMPDVSSGSIGLSDVEITAVIAYLQDIGGGEVTVKIPTDAKPAESGDDDEDDEEGRDPLETGEEIVAKFTCGACHKIGEEEGEVGPDLSKIGGKLTSAELRTAIVDPNASIADGYEEDAMPGDYAEQMYVSELDLLVDYLAKQK